MDGVVGCCSCEAIEEGIGDCLRSGTCEKGRHLLVSCRFRGRLYDRCTLEAALLCFLFDRIVALRSWQAYGFSPPTSLTITVCRCLQNAKGEKDGWREEPLHRSRCVGVLQVIEPGQAWQVEVRQQGRPKEGCCDSPSIHCAIQVLPSGCGPQAIAPFVQAKDNKVKVYHHARHRVDLVGGPIPGSSCCVLETVAVWTVVGHW